MRVRCVFTVSTDMNNCSATSLFERPAATSRATSTDAELVDESTRWTHPHPNGKTDNELGLPNSGNDAEWLPAQGNKRGPAAPASRTAGLEHPVKALSKLG